MKKSVKPNTGVRFVLDDDTDVLIGYRFKGLSPHAMPSKPRKAKSVRKQSAALN